MFPRRPEVAVTARTLVTGAYGFVGMALCKLARRARLGGGGGSPPQRPLGVSAQALIRLFAPLVGAGSVAAGAAVDRLRRALGGTRTPNGTRARFGPLVSGNQCDRVGSCGRASCSRRRQEIRFHEQRKATGRGLAPVATEPMIRANRGTNMRARSLPPKC